MVDDAWVAAIRIGWGRIPLYRDLTRLFGSLAVKGRSEDLLAIYRTLLRFEPQNAQLINNYYYLAVLHEVVAPAAAAKAIEHLIEANPDATEFRSALAMAYLLADRPQDALRQLPTLRTCKRVSPMMCDAIEGAALLLSEKTAEGTALLSRVDWKAFLRCEGSAFRRMLVRLELKNLPLPVMETAEAAPDPESIPEWRKAVERLEKERAKDILPALPAPKVPGADRPPSDPPPADTK